MKRRVEETTPAQNTAILDRLFEHPLVGTGFYSPNDRAIKRAVIREDGSYGYPFITGVYNACTGTLFSEFDYDEARRSAALSRRNAGAPKTERRFRVGRGTGDLVHEQLKDYANFGESHMKLKHPQGIHPYAVCVLKALSAWKLRLRRCELVVFDPHTNIGTSIDMVAEDSRGRTVLLELKTGQEYFTTSNGSLLGPLARMSQFRNCPLHRAFVQLLVAYAILRKFYDHRPTSCWVIHVDQENTTPHRVPDAMLNRYGEIYDHMAAGVLARRKDRRGGKKKKDGGGKKKKEDGEIPENKKRKIGRTDDCFW